MPVDSVSPGDDLQEQASDTDDLLTVGRVTSAHGIKGWVNVQSYTRPQENLLEHRHWTVAGSAFEVSDKRLAGRRLQVKLAGMDDRDAAESIRGQWIQLSRDTLPALDEDEYLWADLIGLKVRNHDAVELGRVTGLMETGANDVLVVEGDRERLIPFDQNNVIRRIDLAEGYIEVDWDPGF